MNLDYSRRRRFDDVDDVDVTVENDDEEELPHSGSLSSNDDRLDPGSEIRF